SVDYPAMTTDSPNDILVAAYEAAWTEDKGSSWSAMAGQ
ncbi:MAG: hypothetical protein ACI8S6_005098, partial [Myxococcota bacterium]